MSFRTDILEAVEDVRNLPGELDIRQFRVFVCVRSWDGARVGVGNATTTETEILVSGYPPKVKELSSRDVVASGGLYSAGDVTVGPMTPEHARGGVSHDVFDPPKGASPTEVYFRIEGPTFVDGWAHFERVSDDTFGNFSHTMVLRQTGKRP